MGYQIVPRSNPHIALGVSQTAGEAPGWGVTMLPQGEGPVEEKLWDVRVLFYRSNPKLPLSVIGTSLVNRKCGLPLLWMRQAGSFMSLGSSSTYVDPFSSWIFSGDTGDKFVYIYPSAPDCRQYTLQLNDAGTRAVMAPGSKENWWFIPYDAGDRSAPISFMSARGDGSAMGGDRHGAVFLYQPSAEDQASQPGNATAMQWRLVTPFPYGVPLNTQFIRNELLGTYLHCSGIGQGLNLVSELPPDHENYDRCLWSPGVTPVEQGFDIPNPASSGAMATIAPWKPGIFGIYLQDWQGDNGINQLWTFQL
jgi:hypothetical protein